MSEEIVRRILTNKKKVLFESKEVEDTEIGLPPVEDTEDLEEVQEETPQDTTEGEVIEKTCECGSTNIIIENGEEICDDCGRKYTSAGELRDSSKRIKEAEKYTKKEILIAALQYWNAGKYEKAMNVCKKYGVPEKEFIRLLVHSYRESEDIEGEDIEESSIIKPDDESKSNIVRAIQKPVSTKNKPEIPDAQT